MSKAIGSLKNDWSIHAVSNAITEHINRGIATSEKVETVLREMKEFGVRNINKLDETQVREIAEHIAEKVQQGEIAGKTGASYISALNAISDYVNHNFDKDINNLKYSELNIHKEIEYRDKAVSETTHQNFQSFIQENFDKNGDNRFSALGLAIELQREFGLRFRESAGLNIETIQQGLETGRLELSRTDWTKNAREREIPIRTEEQRELLNEVKNFMQENKIVNLAGATDPKSYSELKSFRGFSDAVRGQFCENSAGRYSYHGERHFYAQERFSALWEQKTGESIKSPIEYYSSKLEAFNWSGEGKFYTAVKENNIPNWREYVREETGLSKQEIKEIDKEVRQQITEELGHSRLDVTNVYLGHP